MGSISQVAFLVGIPLSQEEGLMCYPQMDWTAIRPLHMLGLLQGATLPAPGEVPGMIRRLSEQDPECSLYLLGFLTSQRVEMFRLVTPLL